MLHLNSSGEGPRKAQGRKRMAATTEKSKPNESRSFPVPSTTQDAVAAQLLPHPHSNNLSSSAGFHSAYVISSDLSQIDVPLNICSTSTRYCPPKPTIGKILTFWVSVINLTMYKKFQDQFLPHDLNQAVVPKDQIVLVVLVVCFSCFFNVCVCFFLVNLSICHCVCCHLKNRGEESQCFCFPISSPP